MKKFTLIELLVVIGIIGILIGILLPAISSAIKEGKKTSAEADLKLIVTGCQAYYQDLQYLPYSHPNPLNNTVDFKDIQHNIGGDNPRNREYMAVPDEDMLNPWDGAYMVGFDLLYQHSAETPYGTAPGNIGAWTEVPGGQILISWE